MDMSLFESLAEFITQFQLVIYPALIGVFAFGYQVWRGIKDKHKELNERESTKSRRQREEQFKKWEHSASLEIIVRIKNACNLYKDRSGADRVMFAQLENGTLATTKLCNMFISCLAEDNRFGNLPKDIRKLRRIPYAHLSDWVDALKAISIEDERETLRLAGDDNNLLRTINAVYTNPVGSHISIDVLDHNKVFIGICIFEYAKKDFDGMDVTKESALIHDFKVSVESTLYNYYVMREKQKVLYDIMHSDITEEEKK